MEESLSRYFAMMGFWSLEPGQLFMLSAASLLIYLAIKRNMEPLLLVPIGLGAFLANIPGNGLLAPPYGSEPGGLFFYLSKGVELQIFPPLIFLGIGAMIDFGPLLARPYTLFLGASTQLGVFAAFYAASALGFDFKEASSIGIIGGADGPTAVYMTLKLAPHLLGPIAVAAYSYMALAPLIQSPIMRLLTTSSERAVIMGPPPPVSKTVRIIFPLIVTFLGAMFIPLATPLLAMLMGGNLLRESGVVDRLSHMAQNGLISLISFFLGTSVGLTMEHAQFLNVDTVKIVALGLAAFVISTVSGLLIGKLMYLISGGKINPLIGSAGVSAVPIAARVSDNVGREANPGNSLLMHAMGPNAAGLIGTIIAAGTLLALSGRL